MSCYLRLDDSFSSVLTYLNPTRQRDVHKSCHFLKPGRRILFLSNISQFHNNREMFTRDVHMSCHFLMPGRRLLFWSNKSQSHKTKGCSQFWSLSHTWTGFSSDLTYLNFTIPERCSHVLSLPHAWTTASLLFKQISIPHDQSDVHVLLLTPGRRLLFCSNKSQSHKTRGMFTYLVTFSCLDDGFSSLLTYLNPTMPEGCSRDLSLSLAWTTDSFLF